METIKIELIRIFVKVVQHGSFTQAAMALELPKSTVSKAVTRLEKITRTKLLVRTTRHQALTDAGKTYYQLCIGPIQALEEAHKSVYGLDSVTTGHIKITAPEDIGVRILSPIIGELSQSYPGLTFELLLTDKVIDLVKSGFELAIRLGKLEDSQLRARTLGNLKLILVASPEYIAQAELIESPEMLKKERFLALNDSSLIKNLILQSKNSKVSLSIQPSIVSNQMSSLIEMAKKGAGIVLVPYFLCKEDLETGVLQRVLPDWYHEEYSVSIVSPLSMIETARLKLVSELFSAAIVTSLKL